jgi:hypothetical protein
MLVPHRIDQPVHRHELAGVDQQRRDRPFLTRAAEP